jgi:NADH-quinone oxidoreductase subunit L
MRKSPLEGLTEKSGFFRGFYRFLENKYYLDDIYEKGVRDGVKGPIANAAYWFNQHVLDAVPNGVGKAAVGLGRGVYRYIDQSAIDGIVNGAGAASTESGSLLRRMQTGKVQQYGALLFGSAVVLAIIFVIVI